MKQIFIATATALMLLLAVGTANANNITVSNVSIAEMNTTSGYVMINFNISWENSWRISSGPSNWDAAWLFVKYRVGTGDWQHATLSTTSGQHVAPSGSTIAAVSDGKGVFMYRSANGTGTVTWTNAQLRWNYQTDGVASNATNVEVKIIGIEMVYVPTGAFYVGDNKTSEASFFSGGTTNPYQITSENAITVANTAGNLYYTTGGDYGDGAGPIPAAFPKGYAAFYCMKYQITQGQYAEFLNLLTSAQATNRYPNLNGNIRHTISGSHPNFSASTPDRACNYLSWADGIAYMDWSCLRPMTELEYEKACRGTLTPVSGEYAWGSTSITTAATITNDGTANETTTTGNCNSNNWGIIDGPLRVGCFAKAGTTRVQSGATYYGIMEMHGNTREKTVTVGNVTGRNFTGINGDGVLDINGHCNTSNCPDNTAVGSGLRGGDWFGDYFTYGTISTRIHATYTTTPRSLLYGFRGVRKS
jgi:formylglycine-generating enzyme required for sulfatase activity